MFRLTARRVSVAFLVLGAWCCSSFAVPSLTPSAEAAPAERLVHPDAHATAFVRTRLPAATPTTPPAPTADEPVPSEGATQPQVANLRRLAGKEMNVLLVREAQRIIHEHHRAPIGTEIPFVVHGRPYVGRIERHYHPEGGPRKPWGPHKGCSLFAVER
jgi:hypothetical protein